MRSKVLDLLGISAAVLCLVHCLLLPVLFIIPFGWEHDAFIDLGFLLMGVAVVYKVTRTIQSGYLKVVFWIAIALIAISICLDLFFHFHSPLMYVGAGLLIIAHLINFKKHKHT